MELDELRVQLRTARRVHAKKVAWASKSVKGVLVIGGAAVAGACQFMTWPKGGSPDAPQIVGIVATVIVAIGGAYVLGTDREAADAIQVADEAIDAAQATETRFEQVGDFFDAFGRIVETYQSCLVMRGAIEQSGVGAAGGIDGLVTNIFQLSARSLTIGMGFAQSDQWTLGVYKAEASTVPHKRHLRCIAQKRAIECRLDEARVWPEGVGVAGLAYLNGREIILPDLQAEGMGTVFGPRDLTKSYDAERYVSMAALPIKVAGQNDPWGVVVATSDKAGHFSADSLPGFKTDEPVRALAAFIALAVAMDGAQNRARAASMSTVSAGSERTS